MTDHPHDKRIERNLEFLGAWTDLWTTMLAAPPRRGGHWNPGFWIDIAVAEFARRKVDSSGAHVRRLTLERFEDLHDRDEGIERPCDPHGIECRTESTGDGPTFHGKFIKAEPLGQQP